MNQNKVITKSSRLKQLVDFSIGIWFLIPLIILKPIKRIYFAPLQSSRIGHFVLDTEILLARIYKDESSQKIKMAILWFPESMICNNFVYEIWREKLHIVPYSKLASVIFSSAIILEKVTKIKLTYRFIDWDGYLPYIHLLESSPRVFGISKETEEECLKELELRGIDTSKKWVCIMDRNHRYLDKTQPNLHWDFNKYRDTDITTYVSAAEYLGGKNIYTFRMGSLTGSQFYSNTTDLLIDYCNSEWRSEKLDIFLLLNCLFLLGTANGLSAVVLAARKPLLDVNLATPLHAIRSIRNHIFITKKFINKKSNSLINVSEYQRIGQKYGFTNDNPRHLRSQDLSKLEISVFENTSTEIVDATIEMFSLVVNSGDSNSELSPEQLKFWEKFPDDKCLDKTGPPKSRVSQKFLLANQYLLE